MPPPDPVWIALALVVWALAISLGERRRTAFIAALEDLASDHDAGRRVVSFTRQNGARRQARRHLPVATAFIARIVTELRGRFR